MQRQLGQGGLGEKVMLSSKKALDLHPFLPAYNQIAGRAEEQATEWVS